MSIKKKIVIIGMDGVRPDAMLKANTPNIDKIANNGIYSWYAQTEFKTISGPAWTSLLTGVHQDKHNVFNNDFSTRNKKYKTIFKLLKEYNSNLRTVAHSHWKPIITKIFEKGALDISSSGSDKKMAFRLVKDIEKNRGDLYFIQLDDCDAAGHKYTYSPDSKRYVKAIETNDRYIGQIYEAIQKKIKNPEQNEEEWLIIIVSDHGGKGKSHGSPSIEELTIVFIVSGTALKEKGEIEGKEENAPMIVDIVPTIAKFLEYPLKEEWDGIARCF